MRCHSRKPTGNECPLFGCPSIRRGNFPRRQRQTSPVPRDGIGIVRPTSRYRPYALPFLESKPVILELRLVMDALDAEDGMVGAWDHCIATFQQACLDG